MQEESTIATLKALLQECVDAMRAAEKYEPDCLPDYRLIAKVEKAIKGESTNG